MGSPLPVLIASLLLLLLVASSVAGSEPDVKATSASSADGSKFEPRTCSAESAKGHGTSAHGWGVKEDAWVPPKEKSPLWEPRLGDYFAPLKDYVASAKPTAKMERVRDISSEHFAEIVARGQPFIIEDAARNLPLKGKSCEWYAKTWGPMGGSMRAEYWDQGRKTGPEWGIFHDPVEHENKIHLSNDLWWSTKRHASRRPGMKIHMMGQYGALSAPYIWHVKDQETMEIKRSVQKHWRAPYFLNNSELNSWESFESFEFWFALPGGGTMAHADAYCDMTMSIQLKGNKRWRFQMMPELNTQEDLFDTHDGQIYSTRPLKWVPEFEELIKEGEGVVFPPNYLHETYIHPDDNPTGECTSATTFQFRYPLCTRYLRAFMPRMAMSSLMAEERCPQRHWRHLPTLNWRHRQPLERIKPKTHAKRVVKKLDTDKDGHVSFPEFKAWFGTAREAEWSREPVWTTGKHHGTTISPEQQARMNQEKHDGLVKDIWTYNDVDRDGKLTRKELAASLRRWQHSLKRFYTTDRGEHDHGPPEDDDEDED